jgi:hypothetical protein
MLTRPAARALAPADALGVAALAEIARESCSERLNPPKDCSNCKQLL